MYKFGKCTQAAAKRVIAKKLGVKVSNLSLHEGYTDGELTGAGELPYHVVGFTKVLNVTIRFDAYILIHGTEKVTIETIFIDGRDAVTFDEE